MTLPALDTAHVTETDVSRCTHDVSASAPLRDLIDASTAQLVAGLTCVTSIFCICTCICDKRTRSQPTGGSRTCQTHHKQGPKGSRIGAWRRGNTNTNTKYTDRLPVRGLLSIVSQCVCASVPPCRGQYIPLYLYRFASAATSSRRGCTIFSLRTYRAAAAQAATAAPSSSAATAPARRALPRAAWQPADFRSACVFSIPRRRGDGVEIPSR